VQQLKDGIVKCSWLAAIFTLGCLVFGSLWSGLSALGDAWGASIAQGLFWGFVISWGLNGATLIGLLTANALRHAPASRPTFGRCPRQSHDVPATRQGFAPYDHGANAPRSPRTTDN
jgi:hypothetical protein